MTLGELRRFKYVNADNKPYLDELIQKKNLSREDLMLILETISLNEENATMENKEIIFPKLEIKDKKVFLNGHELETMTSFKLEKKEVVIAKFTPTLYVEFKDLDY